MSKPLFEGADLRDAFRVGFSNSQLLRRPVSVRADAEVSWIRFWRDVDVTFATGVIRNPLIADTNTIIEESATIGPAMVIETREEGGIDRYVVEIHEPGIYTTRFTASVGGLTATTVVRMNIEVVIIQESIGGNQHYEYTELTSAFTLAAAFDSVVVTQEDIDAIDASDPANNYIHPRFRQESGSDKTVDSSSFMIWRISAAGVGESS